MLDRWKRGLGMSQPAAGRSGFQVSSRSATDSRNADTICRGSRHQRRRNFAVAVSKPPFWFARVRESSLQLGRPSSTNQTSLPSSPS